MEVYILRADADKYQNLTTLAPRDWEDVFRQFDGRQLAPTWQPVRVRMLEDELDISLPRGDFPSLSSHIPVFSQHASGVLKDLIRSEGEFLPLLCADMEYLAFNVTNLIDALNMSKSQVKLFKTSARIMRILEYQFDPIKLSDTCIFKLPQLPLMHVYVTDKFVDRVVEFHLRGFLFERVWSGL